MLMHELMMDDECDTGDKAFTTEDEGSTGPISKRVKVGGSSLYKVDRKLGKWGFDKFVSIVVWLPMSVLKR